MRRASAIVLLIATSCLAWTLASDTFLYWDDNRFLVDPIPAATELGPCLTRAVTAPLFEAYHPAHAVLLCLQRQAGPPQESILIAARMVSTALALALAITWLFVARSFDFRRSLAVLGLAVWWLHPAMVEIWTAFASQKDAMGLVFYLIALGASRSVERRGGRRLVLAATFLAGACKSAYSTVGLVLLAEQFLRREQRGSKPPRWSIVAGLVSVGWMVVAWWVAQDYSLSNPTRRVFDPALVGSTLTAYFELLVWPRDLSPTPCLELSPTRALFGFAVLIALAFAALSRHGAASIRLGSLIALFGLLPFANIVPTPFLLQLRYAALPLLGLGLAIGGLNLRPSEPRGRLLLVALSILTVLNSLALVRESQHWQNRLALWSHATEVSGHCGEPTPWLNLATARVAEKSWEDAELALVEALRQNPDREKTLRDWWLLILLRGSCGQAPVEPRHASELARTMPFTEAETERLPEALRPAFSFFVACRAERIGARPDPAALTRSVEATRACDGRRGELFAAARDICERSRHSPQ